MLKRGFFSWVVIVGLIPAVVKLVLAGAILPGEAAALLIVMVVILAASRRAFSVVAPFAGGYVFIRSLALQNKAALVAITAQLLALSITLLGFWIMFQGVLPARRRRP